MSVESASHDEERDRRLGEALDGYIEHLECGETVSPEDWIKQFPDVADELRECLAVLPLMQQARQHAVTVREGEDGAAWTPSVPGYTLLEEIGRGGMGLVYRARQHSTKRIVALKFLALDTRVSPAARQRFGREVELAAALDHPGIVRVLEADESAAEAYYAMEFVDGQPLHVYLQQRQLDVSAKLRLYLQVIEAVQYAHVRGVIHRDLKPSNIMVDSTGRPRILDFGLACLEPEEDTTDEAARVTQDGQLLGTLPYFSPEQAAGQPAEVDMRSDLYALGVILYEMLAGRLPYQTGGSLAAALQNISHSIPPRPSRYCDELNADIDAVVLKALEKSKEDRYQTAAELAKDIYCCLRGEPAEANRSSRFYLLRKAYARHRTQVRVGAAGVSLVLVASIVILTLYVQVQHERDRLAEQLHLSQLRRGLAHLAAGHELQAGRLLWSAYLDRPDPHAYWSLTSYFVRNPSFAHCGADEWVTTLTFSPDGRFIVRGTLDGNLAIAETTSYETVQRVPAHTGAVARVAFSPAGELLASGGADGRVRLWRTDGWQAGRDVEAHVGGVTQLRFALSNRMLTAGADGQVLLWNPGSKTDARTIFIDQDRKPIVACDISSSGRLIAIATSDGLLQLLDAESGTPVAEPQALGHAVEAIRFSPDEQVLAVWSSAQVSLWEIGSGNELWVRPAGLAEPRPTSLWDFSPEAHVAWRPSLEFSDDGSLLVSSGWDAVVRIWGVETGHALGELRAHGTAVYAVAFQPDSRRLAASYIASIPIWDLDYHPATMCHKVSPGLERTCVAVSGAAGLMAWGDVTDGTAGAIRMMRLTPPRDVTTWRAHATLIEAITFDADGNRVATADRNGNVVVWDVATHEELRKWPAANGLIQALAFSPDGKWLASGDLNGEVHVWNLADGSVEQAWAAHRGLVLALQFAPDGSWLASGGADWKTKVWQLGRREPVAERLHHEWVTAVAFSPDSQRLATGSADLHICIGEPGALPAVDVWNAHAHWVMGVGFVEDGRVLVSGGYDAAIRFWNTSTGQELAMLPSPWGPVHSIAVTRNGRYVAIGAAEAVQLIDLGTTAELIRKQRARY